MESAEPVVRGRFQLSSFRESWKHCSQASNYLARLIVEQLPGAFYLYSAVLNELFEIVYRDAGGEGTMDVSVRLCDDEVSLEFGLPAVSTFASTWQAFAAAGPTPERLADSYLASLLDDEPHPALGLLQIAADYGVDLSLAERDGQSTLFARMRRIHS